MTARATTTRPTLANGPGASGRAGKTQINETNPDGGRINVRALERMVSMTKRLLTALLPLAMILAACQSAPSDSTPRAGRTRTPNAAITATLEAVDAAAGPPGTQAPAPRTPEPTFDFPAFILTQAYSQFTPLAANTPLPAATAATGAPFSNTRT